MLVLPAAAKSPKSAAALKIHKICGCPQNPLVFKPLSYLLTLHTLQAALFISLGWKHQDYMFTEIWRRSFERSEIYPRWVERLRQTSSNECKKRIFDIKSFESAIIETLFKDNLSSLRRMLYKKNQIAWFQFSILLRAGSMSKWSMKSMFWANEKLSLMVAWSLSVSIFCFRVQNST